MKYYAVTDDPNELMHWGVKGMKWGVIRTDAQLGHPKKPRSAAYKRASNKLGNVVKSGIKKAEAKWQVYNSPENKQIRAENRIEKRYQKHLQLARQGRLKYKKVSDDEIARIQDRLYRENVARNMSGREDQSFARRLKTAAQEGILSGVETGTAGYLRERYTGRGRATARIKEEQRMAAYHNSLRGRLAQNREARADDRKMRRDVQREADKEYYKLMAENGEPINSRSGTVLKNIGTTIASADKALWDQQTARFSGKEVPKFSDAYLDYYGEHAGSVTRRARAAKVSANKAKENERKVLENQRNIYEANYYRQLASKDASNNRQYNDGWHPTYNAGASSNPIRNNISTSNTPKSNIVFTSVKKPSPNMWESNYVSPHTKKAGKRYSRAKR